jgi:hypothetical protein
VIFGTFPEISPVAEALIHDLKLLLGDHNNIVENADLNSLLQKAYEYSDVADAIYQEALKESTNQMMSDAQFRHRERIVAPRVLANGTHQKNNRAYQRESSSNH